MLAQRFLVLGGYRRRRKIERSAGCRLQRMTENRCGDLDRSLICKLLVVSKRSTAELVYSAGWRNSQLRPPAAMASVSRAAMALWSAGRAANRAVTIAIFTDPPRLVYPRQGKRSSASSAVFLAKSLKSWPLQLMSLRDTASIVWRERHEPCSRFLPSFVRTHKCPFWMARVTF